MINDKTNRRCKLEGVAFMDVIKGLTKRTLPEQWIEGGLPYIKWAFVCNQRQIGGKYQLESIYLE